MRQPLYAFLAGSMSNVGGVPDKKQFNDGGNFF